MKLMRNSVSSTVSESMHQRYGPVNYTVKQAHKLGEYEDGFYFVYLLEDEGGKKYVVQTAESAYSHNIQLLTRVEDDQDN